MDLLLDKLKQVYVFDLKRGTLRNMEEKDHIHSDPECKLYKKHSLSGDLCRRKRADCSRS